MEIKTVAELRLYLADLPDNMPVWLGETTIEGGLDYYDRVKKYSVEVTEISATFGILLPKDKQRTETGLVIF
jgi:hypothetical protein